jgi:hypothetical protein
MKEDDGALRRENRGEYIVAVKNSIYGMGFSLLVVMSFNQKDPRGIS